MLRSFINNYDYIDEINHISASQCDVEGIMKTNGMNLNFMKFVIYTYKYKIYTIYTKYVQNVYSFLEQIFVQGKSVFV